MNKEFAILLCRGIALFFILKGLNLLPDLIIALQRIDPSEADEVITYYLFGNILAPLLIGIFIFWKSGLLGLILISSSKDEIRVDDHGLVRAGSFILGLWLIIRGVNEVVSYLVLKNSMEDPYVKLSIMSEPILVEKIVVTASSFIIGILLILGSKYMVKLYTKIKYA